MQITVPAKPKLDVIQIYEDQFNLLRSYANSSIPDSITIGIVVPSRKPKHISQFLNNLALQTLKPTEILILIQNYSNEDKVLLASLATSLNLPVTISEDNSDTHVGTRTNNLVEQIQTDIVLRMDDDDLYFPYYLEYKIKSLIHQQAALTGNMTIITKDMKDGVTGLYLPDYQKKDNLCIAGTLCFWKDEYLKAGGMSDEKQRSGLALQTNMLKAGVVIKSSDMFNFVLVRNIDEGHLTPYTTIYSKFNRINEYVVGAID